MTGRSADWVWTANGLRGQMTQIDWQAPEAWKHVDPYLPWFDLTGFAGALLPESDAVRVLKESKASKGPTPLTKSTSVRFEDLAQLCRDAAENPEEVRFELSVAWATPDQNAAVQTSKRLKKKASRRLATGPVVAGFIDIGCAFANRQFRIWNAKGPTRRTRVAALWDQGEVAADSKLPWATPAKFGYGAEVHGPDLNRLMQRHTQGGWVDERACYEEAGHAPITRWATHGTHILDVATGYPNPVPWAPPGDAPAALTQHPNVIFVSLPRTVRHGSTGGLLRAQVLDGLRYIISRAPEKARIVVNLSYGAYAGAHDGRSIIEQAIDQEINRCNGRLKVVVAAGNAGDRRLHAVAELGAKATAMFHWNLMPDDPTDSFLEFWCSKPDAPIELRVTPPGCVPPGGDKGWVRPGHAGAWVQDGQIGALLGLPQRACQGPLRMALLAAGPTARLPGRPALPDGQWRVEVRNLGPDDLTVDAWCERDDPAFGSERAPRQGFLSDTKTSRVVTFNTLSSVSHGKKTIVAGACVHEGPRTKGSSRGDKRRDRRRLSVLAPSDESSVRPGIPGTAVISGHTLRLDGTSVSAAYTSRWLLEQAASEQKASRAKAAQPPKTTLPKILP